MITFEKPGQENSQTTLKLALEAARRENCPIVISSNEGASTQALLNLLPLENFTPKIISVTHVAGFSGKGKLEMPPETRSKLEAQGVTLLTATHALSAGERQFSSKFGGIYPLELVAHTLRMLGQGSKVCVEIVTMAMDAGLLPYGQPVVAVGGTGRGVDTTLLLTPSYSATLLDTRIHEIYCKPNLR